MGFRRNDGELGLSGWGLNSILNRISVAGLLAMTCPQQSLNPGEKQYSGLIP